MGGGALKAHMLVRISPGGSISCYRKRLVLDVAPAYFSRQFPSDMRSENKLRMGRTTLHAVEIRRRVNQGEFTMPFSRGRHMGSLLYLHTHPLSSIYNVRGVPPRYRRPPSALCPGGCCTRCLFPSWWTPRLRLTVDDRSWSESSSYFIDPIWGIYRASSRVRKSIWYNRCILDTTMTRATTPRTVIAASTSPAHRSWWSSH